MTHETISSTDYAEQLATQLRKGFLAYCVLKTCSHESKYTSDIITQLRDAELVVVEGTIYPLLSRLQKDGLLSHEWQESEHRHILDLMSYRNPDCNGHGQCSKL